MIVDLPAPGGPITPTTVKSVLSVRNWKNQIPKEKNAKKLYIYFLVLKEGGDGNTETEGES